ncbi:monovalent cation/H(+) antiporter subunit G [Leucobacter chromiiresistens]|uniref:Multisubunit sodium/proton antiporter, MrpG subunit n=1 Tax=Leucobacter chromiiresistens TaxID=1079994 RepID=A0A1H0ZM84_9MICO|nr:monovalent cation/H(+) antiporter subunit G [Leucobacter chromiiresistens]SDQ28492.1 multisubunit sodium/proton antiporter, MrpG subunit [Leucobacter chromiiresistens]
MYDAVLDLLAAICVFLAAVLSAAAGVGLLRFPDALSRLHAATKPQIFGLLLVITAIALEDRSVATLLALVPVFVFQSLTAPVAAHMVGRAAYRTGQLEASTLVVDELGPAIDRMEASAGQQPSAQSSAQSSARPSAPAQENGEPDSERRSEPAPDGPDPQQPQAGAPSS